MDQPQIADKVILWAENKLPLGRMTGGMDQMPDKPRKLDLLAEPAKRQTGPGRRGRLEGTWGRNQNIFFSLLLKLD
jgi:hypothetical protein